MSRDLHEIDILERAPSERPPEDMRQPQYPRRVPPSRARRRSRRNRMSLFSLLLSAMALIIAVTSLVLVLRGGGKDDAGPSADAPPEDEPFTFRFGDMRLTPLEGMPLNSYDKSGFASGAKGRITYEKDGLRAKTGIDVSTHQQEIDWQAVAADGIDFAMLRIGRRGYSEGGLFPDDAFARNLQGALDAGLEVGVYFFSQAVTPEEAEEEADYVLESLNGQELSYPVAFDWESITEDEARTDGVSGAAMTRCAAAFCKKIEAAGYRPAVYFNRTQGYLHYDLRDLRDYDLWLAEYDTVPDFFYHFDLWQYTHTGQVDGIQGNVDLDLAFP